MPSTAWQAKSFALIGVAGFLVDGSILTLLHNVLGWGLVDARLVSFSAAVTVTWRLNRARTFSASRDRRPVREWGRYAAVNAIGALLNLAIFLWLTGRYEALAAAPLVALAAAAGVALVFNFVASKHFAFRQAGP